MTGFLKASQLVPGKLYRLKHAVTLYERRDASRVPVGRVGYLEPYTDFCVLEVIAVDSLFTTYANIKLIAAEQHGWIVAEYDEPSFAEPAEL